MGERAVAESKPPVPACVLSCLEQAVWRSSQLKMDEEHYAFRSRSRSLPAALLREGSAQAQGKLPSGAASKKPGCVAGRTSPEAWDLALPGRAVRPLTYITHPSSEELLRSEGGTDCSRRAAVFPRSLLPGAREKRAPVSSA